MENKLLQELSQYSLNRFDFFKLSYINVVKDEYSVEVALLYPEEQEKLVLENRVEIISFITKIVNTKLNLKVRLIKSCFFADIFIGEFMNHIEAYPSLQVSVSIENIQIADKDGGKIISLMLPTSSYEYLSQTDVLTKIKNHFHYKYHVPLEFEFREVVGVPPSTENIERFIKKEASETLHLEKEGGRVINVGCRFEFIGPIVEQDASYISDARINDVAVHCGTVEDLTALFKHTKTEDEPAKKFYRFKLTDFTGSMTCLYFPNAKTETIIENLCDGKAIIGQGKTVADKYNDDGSILFLVKNISLCTMPKRFKENRIMRKVAPEYLTVFPKPYIKPIQSSLFETEVIIPNKLKNKRFCVFDIETTGLDPKTSEIMEIGAAIIDNGVIKETFNSFISIENSVPEKITQLTGIDDSHLVGQPCLKDVLADFMKFSHKVPLVGHNVAFDYGFISHHGEKHNIYFDNDRIDTIVLAKRYLPNLKNYQLKTLVSKLEIKNNDAHRALSDTIATAEAFIKLAKLAQE